MNRLRLAGHGLLPRNVLGCVALFCAAIFIGGCSGDSRGQAVKIPPAYRPEGFPDIALERLRGYRLDPDEEPLALAYANGALRRFHVTFQTKDSDEPEDPVRVRDRLAGGLTEQGWTRTSPAGAPATAPETWSKNQEALTIITEANSSRLKITIDLASTRPL